MHGQYKVSDPPYYSSSVLGRTNERTPGEAPISWHITAFTSRVCISSAAARVNVTQRIRGAPTPRAGDTLHELDDVGEGEGDGGADDADEEEDPRGRLPRPSPALLPKMLVS